MVKRYQSLDIFLTFSSCPIFTTFGTTFKELVCVMLPNLQTPLGTKHLSRNYVNNTHVMLSPLPKPLIPNKVRISRFLGVFAHRKGESPGLNHLLDILRKIHTDFHQRVTHFAQPLIIRSSLLSFHLDAFSSFCLE